MNHTTIASATPFWPAIGVYSRGAYDALTELLGL
jgi:hypothetical protein